jgi:putative transposase
MTTTMKRHRHTPEQVVRKVREGERLLSAGKDLTEVLRHLEIAESTWNRWRAQYGGMKGDEVRRLKELERENGRLKKIVADQALDIDMLKELAEDAPIDQVGCASAAKSVRRAWNISLAR